MGGEPTTEPTSDPPFDDGTPLAPLIPLNPLNPLATLAIEALEPLLILAAPLATFANDSGLSFTSGTASMSTPSTLPCGPCGPCGTAIFECGDIGTGVDMPDILAEYTDASSLALSPTPLWTLAVWSRASVCVWWMKRHLVPYGQVPVVANVLHTSVLYFGWRCTGLSSSRLCANWHLLPYLHCPNSSNERHSSVLYSGLLESKRTFWFCSCWAWACAWAAPAVATSPTLAAPLDGLGTHSEAFNDSFLPVPEPARCWLPDPSFSIEAQPRSSIRDAGRQENK